MVAGRMGWSMLVDERSLLILAIVISLLSLMTNLIELSVMMSIRPIVNKLVETMAGVQAAAIGAQAAQTTKAATGAYCNAGAPDGKSRAVVLAG
jgi:hypothetical protein